MGPYCLFCDRRCFVERRLPSDADHSAGQVILMATCKQGKLTDYEWFGYDASTAINENDLTTVPAWDGPQYWTPDPLAQDEVQQAIQEDEYGLLRVWPKAYMAYKWARIIADTTGRRMRVRKARWSSDVPTWKIEEVGV